MENNYSVRFPGVALSIILLLGATCVQAQLPQGVMPDLARPDLFTFYEDNNVNMPAGADRVSKSVIYVQGVDPGLPNPYDGAGTAFIIRTFRDDDFMCVCMSGHQAKLLNGRVAPGVPSLIDTRTIISMDYKGRNYVNPSDGETYIALHEWASSYLTRAIVAAYYFDPSQPQLGDYALLLVNRRDLPSGNFVALGYDFGVINASNYQNYFSISHPLGYPQRLSKNLAYYNDANNMVEFDVQKPYAMSSGSSGAPLVNATTTSVQGIESYIKNWVTYTGASIAGPTLLYRYGLRMGFTRMSLLESAIKEHCWKNANKEQILSSGIYKQSVEVPNPKLSLLWNTNLSIF
ncbi:hypothetical protein, partial [Rurimicrobium arvi]